MASVTVYSADKVDAIVAGVVESIPEPVPPSNYIVLGAADPIPSGTEDNTVIVRVS